MRISDWSSYVCSSDLADHIVLCIPAQERSIVRSMLFLGRCLEALDDQHPEFINSLDSALNFGDFDELHIVPPVTHGYNGAQFRQHLGHGRPDTGSRAHIASVLPQLCAFLFEMHFQLAPTEYPTPPAAQHCLIHFC